MLQSNLIHVCKGERPNPITDARKLTYEFPATGLSSGAGKGGRKVVVVGEQEQKKMGGAGENFFWYRWWWEGRQLRALIFGDMV